MEQAVPLPVRDASLKDRVVTALRVAFALVPLVIVASRVDFDSIPNALVVVGSSGALLAIGFQVLGVVFGAYRWRVLLRTFGASGPRLPGLLTLVRHCFVGLYFSLIPSGLVGDVVRARRTRASLPTPGDAYVVMFVDRVSAGVGLLTVSLVALEHSSFHLASEVVVSSLRVFVTSALVIMLVLLVLPFAVGRSSLARSFLARIPSFGPFLARLTPPKDARGIVVAVLLSVVVEGSFVAAIVATVLPFTTAGAIVAILLRTPIILLLTIMPLTPGGLGQRELVFVTLLEPVGIAPTQATAASLVTLGVSIVLAAAGGLVILADRARRAASLEDDQAE